MDKYSGCHASRNDRIRTQTNSLRKVKNTFAQQLKKRRNSMCYKHCASAIWFLVVYFVTEKKIPYVVTRDVCPSVRPSFVEISLERGCTITNRPIDLKFGLCIGGRVMHVWFRNSNCKLQIYAF